MIPFSELSNTKRDVLISVAALEQKGAAHPNQVHVFHEVYHAPLSRSRLSSILTELVSEGYCSTKQSESDGRVKLYFTTQDGRQALCEEIRRRCDWLDIDVQKPTLAGQQAIADGGAD